jgi:hypothetical protein
MDVSMVFPFIKKRVIPFIHSGADPESGVNRVRKPVFGGSLVLVLVVVH